MTYRPWGKREGLSRCPIIAKLLYFSIFWSLAEGQGFEPWEPETSSTAFEAAAFNRSATLPDGLNIGHLSTDYKNAINIIKSC